MRNRLADRLGPAVNRKPRCRPAPFRKSPATGANSTARVDTMSRASVSKDRAAPGRASRIG